MSDKKVIDDIPEETDVIETEQPQLDEPDVSDQIEEDYADDAPKGPSYFQRAWAAYKLKKKITIPATVLLIGLVGFALPVTRYAVLGVVIKKDLHVKVVDSQTNVPISDVEVSVDGKTAKTDGEGRAELRGVAVGSGELKAKKKYYKDTSNQVLTGLRARPVDVRIEATGRQIPVHIVNSVSGENIAGVSIAVADTQAQTDKNGETTIVLPASQSKVEAKISGDGFNQKTALLTVNNAKVKDNSFALTPTGKLYFLSKQTGKIDVVKTDLDGTNRQTVLAGTGAEEDSNTILLASRDWKFLALLSRREGSNARLYLIETSSDKLTEIDSGDASFTPVGWSQHNFAYSVRRNNIAAWQPKSTALKTYNADGIKLQTIDETNAEGTGAGDYANEIIGNVYVLKDAIVYTKSWSASYYSVYRLAGKRTGIYSAKPSGGTPQSVKEFDAGTSAYFNAKLTKPSEVYFALYNNESERFFEYSGGKISEADDMTTEELQKFYPTYITSPGDNQTFWYEPRDGKNTLLIGNQNGENGKKLASLGEYVAYGWYGDDYVLLSKNSSELYIQSAKLTATNGQALKVSDYHKPNVSFDGYGYGYGGF